MTAPLSAAQLDSFRLNGFLHIPGLIPASELEQVRLDTAGMIDRGAKGPFGDDSFVYGRDASEPGTHCLYRINELLKKHKLESVMLLLAYPPLLRAIAQAVEDDHFASQVHSLVFKLPHRGYPVPWHQDPVKVFRFPVFNVDIYLDEATKENGCLHVLPGSHLGGLHGTPDFLRGWTEGRQEDAPGAVPVLAKPGDVLFHATSVVHGSFWNRSTSMRRTIYFHINHLRDVLMRPRDDGHRKEYGEAQRLTAAAVACRRQRYPQETPFPYREVAPAVLA